MPDNPDVFCNQRVTNIERRPRASRLPERSRNRHDNEQMDFERVTASILITRELVERAANSLNSRRKAVAVLDDMHVAILKYLNVIEENSRDYVNESMRLRERTRVV